MSTHTRVYAVCKCMLCKINTQCMYVRMFHNDVTVLLPIFTFNLPLFINVVLFARSSLFPSRISVHFKMKNSISFFFVSVYVTSARECEKAVVCGAFCYA